MAKVKLTETEKRLIDQLLEDRIGLTNKLARSPETKPYARHIAEIEVSLMNDLREKVRGL
jgi:hypothetical protein